MNDAQLGELLRGALHIWRVEGDVAAAAGICTIRSGTHVVTVARVREDGEAPFWEIGEESEGGPPPMPRAGIHGMLRAVRDILDPAGAAGRLVVGGAS